MDFNQIINRNNTGSVKWDFIERHFGDGAGKLLPMWVSDFDFACPPEVQAALHQRIEHGVFGYSDRDEAYFNALLFSFPILRFASDSCLVWTLMGWTSLTPSPFRRRLPHGMKADSGWIRYWITWRKTAAGLLNRRQSTFPGQELSRRREPIYYGWIVKNWDWMTNS